jgi:hypothetical protein
MSRFAVITAAALTAMVTAAAPAAAIDHQPVARASCSNVGDVGNTTGRGDRLGPFSWTGHWDGYAQWSNMEQLRDPRDGTYYAKLPMYLRKNTVASLSIARSFRDNADFVYGRGRDESAVLSDVVRFRSCRGGTTLYPGGLVVTGPTCVLIEARVRGSRRVRRQMISINMGASCVAWEPVAAGARPRPTVSYARCDHIAPQRDVVAARERFGPATFIGNWDGYAQWLTMERFRSAEGTYYAKNGIGVRPRAVGTLSIAPAYRGAADFVYGRGRNGRSVLSDVVRIRGCARRSGFVSGGLVVRGPACVLIEARTRGSRRVHRRMVSINMGPNCPPAT